uniref:Selenoprotein K n=1 Tax=Urocitellus parryii TaxID=9999 RepID=A0A8D2HQY0_UROPR
MVYISNGQVLDSRSQSPWRLSLITDFFWGIAEFVVLFTTELQNHGRQFLLHVARGGRIGVIMDVGHQRKLFNVEKTICSFKTLLQQDVKKRRGYGNSSDSRYDDGRGPPGNPPRRMGRINHLQGPSPPPMGGG